VILFIQQRRHNENCGNPCRNADAGMFIADLITFQLELIMVDLPWKIKQGMLILLMANG